MNRPARKCCADSTRTTENGSSFYSALPPESAAGLMNLDYITVENDKSLEDVAKRVRRFEER